jgi:protease secretion system outer membrane protein
VDLVEAYNLARKHEPQFQSAAAERDINIASSRQSLAAYLPQANYSMTNIPTDNQTRQVLSITQPIFSLDRLATVRQQGPRRVFANATYAAREVELAQRTFRAVFELIRANENVKLNQAKVSALREQSDRATRMYSAGQGTVTDSRDIEVRYEQAMANQLLLEGEAAAANNKLSAMMGEAPGALDFKLPDQNGEVDIQPIGVYETSLLSSNPQILASRQSERVSELDAQRVKGGLLPTINATASKTYTGKNDISYVGISVTAPITAGGFIQASSASAQARRATNERLKVEQDTQVNFERLYALVNAGQKALNISRKAINSAELSVQATRKSYEGGVRSNFDVVNAIQTVFEVKSQYVTSATTVADNMLNMLLLAGVEPTEALTTTQRFLLGK